VQFKIEALVNPTHLTYYIAIEHPTSTKWTTGQIAHYLDMTPRKLAGFFRSCGGRKDPDFSNSVFVWETKEKAEKALERLEALIVMNTLNPPGIPCE
jgi:hypothetical protein